MTTFKQLLILGIATILVGAGAEVIPWPGGSAPGGSEFEAHVADALDRDRLERVEEFMEAQIRGEDREHITVLQSHIDEGLLDADALFTFGDALFEHEFSSIDGWGKGQFGIQRVHDGKRGGLDTFSCASCHSLGGADGAGTFQQNAFLYGDGQRISSALPRNAPSLLGVGLIQSLADEMTRMLATVRKDAIWKAKESGEPITIDLIVKSVSYGQLTALPNGLVDTSDVEGIDPDLVVRPFGWKGEFATLRAFLEDASRIHFGIQSHGLAMAHQNAPKPDELGRGEDWWDPDSDGIAREIEVGTVTAGAVYLALLESPVVIPPHDEGLRDIWARGSEVFDEVECSSCHVRSLLLTYSKWIEGPNMAQGEGFEFSVFNDGEQPKSVPDVELYSDLKRHDMGDELADTHENARGISRSVYRTPPLWGLADTAPYLHDGRALTVTDAIEAHGGEGSDSRDKFRALSQDDKAALRVFLMSLTREPKLRISR